MPPRVWVGGDDPAFAELPPLALPSPSIRGRGRNNRTHIALISRLRYDGAMNDLPLTAPHPAPSPGSNLPEYSVSELSLALKRSIEGEFGQVRVRGEVSGFKRPGSGH